MKSSLISVFLISAILVPTTFYHIFGSYDSISFNHISSFPTIEMLKLSIIIVGFIVFNELLARNLITIDFIYKTFVIAVLLSIPKYFPADLRKWRRLFEQAIICMWYGQGRYKLNDNAIKRTPRRKPGSRSLFTPV